MTVRIPALILLVGAGMLATGTALAQSPTSAPPAPATPAVGEAAPAEAATYAEGAQLLVPVSPDAPDPADPAPAPSAITAAEDSASNDDIVVIGDSGNSFRLTADSLRDAVRAFNEHRERFAPAATLYFLVEAGDGGSLDGVNLYLRARRRDAEGDRAYIDLPLDADNRITLPLEQVASGDWELRANRARGGIRMRPQILSPGSAIADRRFGDMRLQCRVAIAFARLGLPVRLLAGAVGPCGSSAVSLVTRAPQPISAVTISDYATPIEIRADGISFVVPLQDDSISNEARLRLTYR